MTNGIRLLERIDFHGMTQEEVWVKIDLQTACREILW
jgi:hypothetical protein